MRRKARRKSPAMDPDKSIRDDNFHWIMALANLNMQFDIFFSISQTPANGLFPSESEMFRNFIEQVQAADELGYKTAWVAESHLSSEVQKSNKNPVIPHWEGEVGLNSDIFQLALTVFNKTRKIEVGSAVMNILCNGGPIAAVKDGDIIEIDIPNRRLNVDLTDAVIKRRLKEVEAPKRLMTPFLTQYREKFRGKNCYGK